MSLTEHTTTYRLYMQTSQKSLSRPPGALRWPVPAPAVTIGAHRTRLPPVGTCGEAGVTPGDTLRASLAALCMTENHKGGRAAAARPASRALACPAAQGHQQPRFCRHGAARGAKAPRRGGRRRPESAGRAQERTRSRPRRTERQTVSPKGWDGREAGLGRLIEEGAKVREAKGQGGRDEAPLAREVVAGQRV